jgi:hypothetical protein
MFATIDAMAGMPCPEFFHAEIVYERPSFPPMRGLDQVLRFYHHERKIVRSVHHVEGAIVQNGRGAAWGRVDSTLTDGTDTELVRRHLPLRP